MKKVLFKVVAVFCFIALQEKGYCQQEHFDIISYTAPPNWQKTAKQGLVTYTTLDTTAETFCVMNLYASRKSSGAVEKDFKSEWKTLAITPYKADKDPSTEVVAEEGWKAITAASAVKIDNIDSYIILTVFTGFGKTFSLVAILNDLSYLPQFETFIANLNIDKTGTPQVTVESTTETSGEKFGHMIYPSLKGWTSQRYNTSIIFKPVDLEPDHFLEMRILQSKPFTGTLVTAMTESWNELLQQVNLEPAYTGKLYDVVRERRSFKGWEYIRATGMARAPGTTDKYETHLFVIKLNNRIERIAVIGKNNISFGSFSPHSNPEYAEALEAFYFSIKYEDWQEPDLKPASLTGNGLIGLYEGLKLSGGRLGGAYTVFFSNGQIFSAPKFPTRGLHGLNTWIDAERHTGYWGTYTLKNGKGAIHMTHGEIPIKVAGEDLIVTTQNKEHKYEKVSSLDGAVFNGTYVIAGDWGGSPPSITFTKNGEFTDRGAVNIIYHQTTDHFNLAKDPGSGRYEVRDYTLILYYKDGRKLQIVFQDSDYDKKNPSPETLTFSTNHDILHRK